MKIKVYFIVVSVLLVCLHQTAVAEQPNSTIEFSSSAWPPITYKDEAGVSKGLYVDILEELLGNRLDLTITHNILPWSRVQLEVKSGNTDFFISVPTQERLQYAKASKDPIFLLYLNIYTYKDHPKLEKIKQIKTIDDIKSLGLSTVSNNGNGWHKSNIENAGIKTFYVPTEENACLFLAKKRADIMIDAVVPTNKVVKDLGISPKIELTDVRFGPIKMHLLMSKKSPHIGLMEDIDQKLINLKQEGIIDQIVLRYSSLD